MNNPKASQTCIDFIMFFEIYPHMNSPMQLPGNYVLLEIWVLLFHIYVCL